MKALYFTEHSNLIDKLCYGDLSNPVPIEGEALVRVRACALNHLDLWVLAGWPGLKIPLPHIGGSDIAGEVVSLNYPKDSTLQKWEIGDRVVVNPGIVTSDDEWTKKDEDSLSPNFKIIGEHCAGGFAEFVTVPIQNLYRLPDEIDFNEGCASLLVGLTSWRMLKHRAKLAVGDTVLVVGAGGGVNSFSIQLAKYFGAKVIALTSSKDKAKSASDLGASDVINYKKTPAWGKEVKNITNGRGVNVVVDNVGQATINESIKALCPGGKIVTVGNTSGPILNVDNRYIFSKQISIIGSTMGSRKDFEELLPLLWSRKLKSVIDCVFPLSDGKKGYLKLERGGQFGKIILTPELKC